MDESSAARQGLRLVVGDEHTRQTSASGVIPTPAAAGPLSGSIAPGVIVGNKYLVGRPLGQGGFGIVYEAQNLELDEKVALKCLRSEMLADKAMIGRFAREAKAAASIKSEYVANVYDVGTTPDGVPYMVMEYLEGRDLGAVVQNQGVLPIRDAVEYTLHACEALANAHAKNIVHRDIKPDNLMLTERTGGMPIVKILDFGISKAVLTGSIFGTTLPLVKTQNVIGTPLYMSPEQVRNTDTVDIRSDIWSLGMVLYEMLTGTTAFPASSITELCAAILEASPQPIETHRQDIPSGLVDVIYRCLEKEPEHRYPNVAVLALALMPFGPKRARLNVERSMAVLRSAGMLDTRVRVQSTMPPAAAGSLGMEVTSDALRAPSVPEFASAASPPAPPNAAAVSMTGPPLVTTPVPTRSRAPIAIAIVALLMAVGAVSGILISRRMRATPPKAAPTAATTAPTAPTASATSAELVPTAPATGLTSSPPAPTSTGPTASATPTKPPQPRIKPGAKPVGPTTGRPTKQNEEPDLGY